MNPGDSNLSLPAPLPRASLFLRLALIAAILGGIVLTFAYVGGWLTPHALSPKAMVDRFEQLNGPHPGFRRNHAKGLCFVGTFESNGAGAELSKAAVFAPGQVPIVGRFALGGGLPYMPDAPHAVRSLAVLFKTANGEEWRTGNNNIPVFPVNSPQGFYDLLLASAPDPATGKPDGAKMKAFMEKHPEATKAFPLLGANAVSSGFHDSTYNSLNAFLFTNARGETIPVRWALVPSQPVAPAGPPAAAEDKNALFDALIASRRAGSLQWHLVVTIGQPGDVTSDPTIPWPADRRKVDVGTLTVDRLESEDTSPTRDINFDPMILPSGISASDDPILPARSAAYSKSFTRREGEHKDPSAVSASAVTGGATK